MKQTKPKGLNMKKITLLIVALFISSTLFADTSKINTHMTKGIIGLSSGFAFAVAGHNLNKSEYNKNFYIPAIVLGSWGAFHVFKAHQMQIQLDKESFVISKQFKF